METLMQASREWASRPADQRFTSLTDLRDFSLAQRENSVSSVVSTRDIEVQPHQANEAFGITVETDAGKADPTNWAFNQLARLAGAPAGYLAKLPSPIASDAINYGLRFNRDAQDIGMLRTSGKVVGDGAKGTLDEIAGDTLIDHTTIRAATGPQYGRVWNAEIASALVDRFGDGLTGDFRVPGEFGKAVDVTKENTTIYGSDRDVFVFLADEKNRVEMSNRRNGQGGSLARGFFVWNSEVGSSSIGAAFFLFDFACSNRIVWGAQDFTEIRLRHTASAPHKWLEEIAPVLGAYSEASAAPIETTIAEAQKKRVDDDLNAFLKKRFSGKEATAIQAAHEREEGRPIETIWDAVTGVTAFAKTIEHQDRRVHVERQAGKILDLVAV